MAATNLFGNTINIHPFKDGSRRICCLILALVLIQMKCCLFSVILSSFHRGGKRHYIRAVKTFDRKLSMLYSMIVKSLICSWDNFEQNVRMLARCWHLILRLLSKHKFFFWATRTKKMFSVMPFSFNAVELCVVTINEKSWTRAREVCKALEYNKKRTHFIKPHVSPENYAQKCHLGSVHALINWPKYSRIHGHQNNWA